MKQFIMLKTNLLKTKTHQQLMAEFDRAERQSEIEFLKLLKDVDVLIQSTKELLRVIARSEEKLTMIGKKLNLDLSPS